MKKALNLQQKSIKQTFNNNQKLNSMKRRILLSLVSFFAMTTMWASLVDAYQIYVTAGTGKTFGTAELTLNMKNKNATIGTWSCTLVLPAGVTFQKAELVSARFPEGYNAEFVATPNEADNSVKFSCAGEQGVAITGTDGAIATVTVAISGDVEPGVYPVIIKEGSLLEEIDGVKVHHDEKAREFSWTIEQGENPGIKGDFNGDGKVDIADAVCVLDVMAAGTNDAAYDLNNDGKVDIADFVLVLDMMAQQ